MSDWIVGESELLAVKWTKNGSEVTTGTADVYIAISVDGSGVTNWLDTDLSSLTATATGLSLTYNADTGWTRHLDVPESLAGETVYVYYIHSDSTLPQGGPESHRVKYPDAATPGGIDIQLGG